MLPLLALTYTAARLGFEAQNAAAFRLMRFASRPETAAEEIIPEAPVLPKQAPVAAVAALKPVAVAATKKRPAAKTSKKSASAKRQRKRVKGR